jgi:hypothetical protein
MNLSNLFHSLPPHSRVWVYQSDRKFSDAEIESILTRGSHFIREWNTHGASVAGDIDVLFGCFVVIVANEEQQMVSGCAIDKSVSLIKEIEQELKVNLFDRFSVATYVNDKITPMPINNFVEQIKNGVFNTDTLVFNNTITTLKQLRSEWIIPIKLSWHSKFVEVKEEMNF